MVLSMTGFVTRTIIYTHGSVEYPITISLKSLNNRFFDAYFKAPSALLHLETKIGSLLREHLFRGTVYCTINSTALDAALSSIKPNMVVAQEYITALQAIAAHTKISHNVQVSDLLQLPNIFTITDSSATSELEGAILDAVKESITLLTKERRREGKALEKDLLKRFEHMTSLIAKIKERAALLYEVKREALLQQVATIAEVSQEAKEHHLLSMHSQLDKMNINEEIVRFSEHLKNITAVIHDRSKEKGKRCDFTLQELLREINTIGAKIPDAEITSASIAIKVELEKAREQVQNIV